MLRDTQIIGLCGHASVCGYAPTSPTITDLYIICMRACVRACVRACIYIYTRAHAHTHIYMHVMMHSLFTVRMHVYMYVRTYVHIRNYIIINVCLYGTPGYPIQWALCDKRV